MQELRQLAAELAVDVICIQEPYTIKGKVPFMPIQSRIIADGKRPWAAMVVINKELTITKIHQHCSTHFNTVEVATSFGRWRLVNAYFQDSDPIEPYIGKMEEILLSRDTPTILTLDSNARSTWWHDSITEPKGATMEEAITALNLSIMNEPHNPPTYVGRAGAESRVDLTLTNVKAAGLVKEWKVLQSATTSDHNAILFEVDRCRAGNPLIRSTKYNIKRANWDKLKEIFELPTPVVAGDDVDKKAIELTTSIKRAMDLSIPKIKGCNAVINKVWNSELTNARRAARKARSHYQRANTEQQRLYLLDVYRRLKDQYKAKLLEVRTKSWENFVNTQLTTDVWGVPYKLAVEKIRPTDIISTLERGDGTTTTTREETLELLMDVLLPDDKLEDDNENHVVDRAQMSDIYINQAVVCPFAEVEVENAIRIMKKGKAPGPDAIKAEVLHNLAPKITSYLCTLLNECLIQGRVPSCWKTANLVILKKGADKDPKNPKSYRPICLLNTLGKVQERLLCKRIKELRVLSGMSDNQYGFRKGRSTEDAINRALHVVEESKANYIIAIFVDISGAFDNLWWPALFARLRELRTPMCLYESLKDYCRARKVNIRGPQRTMTKYTTKGCPQGSVLGPEFWDISLEPILDMMSRNPDLTDIVAYADDILFLIDGRNRLELETKSRRVLNIMHEWCTRVKLQLAPHKTTYMLLKGKLLRNPVVKLNGVSIRRTRTTKYLGVLLDEHLNFNAHITDALNRGVAVMNKITTIGQRRFNIPMDCIRTYHNSVLRSVVGYAASVWAHRINLSYVSTKIRRAQRAVLLRMTGAFSTTAGESLLISVGLWPLDLQILEQASNYWLKKQKPEKVTSLLNAAAANRRDIRNALLNRWQSQWDTCEKGRRVHEIFPNVRERLGLKHLNPSRGLMHYITGHGPYMSYLYKIKKANSCDCTICNVPGTPEHSTFECPLNYDLQVDHLPPLSGRQVGEIIRNANSWMNLNTLADTVSKHAPERLDNMIIPPIEEESNTQTPTPIRQTRFRTQAENNNPVNNETAQNTLNQNLNETQIHTQTNNLMQEPSRRLGRENRRFRPPKRENETWPEYRRRLQRECPTRLGFSTKWTRSSRALALARARERRNNSED